MAKVKDKFGNDIEGTDYVGDALRAATAGAMLEQRKQDSVNQTNRDNNADTNFTSMANQDSSNATSRANSDKNNFTTLAVNDAHNTTQLAMTDKNNTAMKGVRDADARLSNANAAGVTFNNGVATELRPNIVSSKRSLLKNQTFDNDLRSATTIRAASEGGFGVNPAGISPDTADMLGGPTPRNGNSGVATPAGNQTYTDQRLDPVMSGPANAAASNDPKKFSNLKNYDIGVVGNLSGAKNIDYIDKVAKATGNPVQTRIQKLRRAVIPFSDVFAAQDAKRTLPQ